jgi:hypothetical protein
VPGPNEPLAALHDFAMATTVPVSDTCSCRYHTMHRLLRFDQTNEFLHYVPRALHTLLSSPKGTEGG